MTESLSRQLAQYIVSIKYDDIPAEVVEFTKLCILDWCANAVAGKNETPVKWINDVVKEMGGEQQASLVTGGSTSVLYAALVNGAASHVIELDDIHKRSIIHAATVVIPSALAVAEWKNQDGKALITAVSLGYEISYRIGEAVTPSHYYYWHNTSTCGTFGASTAVAKLLDLNEDQLVHTFGSAGTQAAGLWEFIEDGAMSKQLHTAKAGFNGMLSALLSVKGFTGATKILEGDRGFFNAMSSDYNVSRITNGLGEEFKILENSFKLYASCRHTHSAIDLALDLVSQHQIKTTDIQKIEIGTYKAAIEIAGNPNPNTIYASKFSIPYCVAMATVLKRVDLKDFNMDHLQDKQIHDIQKKVKVFVSKEMEAEYPDKWGTELQILLSSGEVIKGKTYFPKGDPENPISKEDIIKKFKALTYDLPEKSVSNCIEDIMSLEKKESVSFLKELINNNSIS